VNHATRTSTLKKHTAELHTCVRQAEAFDEDDPRHWRPTLERSLQLAVSLELSTVPPYLCALWSIQDELHPVAVSVREIVQQEMLHLGLACNMLVAIGATPDLPAALPRYPGPLPGGVHEGLTVELAGLTKKALCDFMWIERPLHGFPERNPHAADVPWVESLECDETIGEFYEAIKTAFVHHQPHLSLDRQITGPLAWRSVATIDDVVKTIELIQVQGEGSSRTPTNDRGSLSHYYRFREVYLGCELLWDREQKTLLRGRPIAFPEVWPMAAVPLGGYAESDVTPEVWHLVDRFDDTFTRLLEELQSAWTLRGGQARFIEAISTMFELENYARPLMAIAIPGQTRRGTYGPCFRYKRGGVA